MPTQILAVAATAADSSDVVIASGEELSVSLKSSGTSIADTSAWVKIQRKDDAGLYFDVAELTYSRPALVIDAAGTYRFRRVAGGSCGVFSD